MECPISSSCSKGSECDHKSIAEYCLVFREKAKSGPRKKSKVFHRRVPHANERIS